MPSAPNFKAYRGEYGAKRPQDLNSLSLPPEKLPLFNSGVLRKQWRYVAVHSPEVQICAANVSIGPFKQMFWAVWDRENKKLHEHTSIRNIGVEVPEGRLLIRDAGIEVELDLDEGPGVETVSPSGKAWTWTRKQGGITATGRVSINGRELVLSAPAVVDDSAGFHPRHTDWLWSSGVGTNAAGQAIAWNMVNGLNDIDGGSEQTVWVDGVPTELGPPNVSTDLSNVTFTEGGQLNFAEEAVRRANENRVLLKSRYSQPFGTFSGSIPHAGEITDGLGVMERHSALW